MAGYLLLPRPQDVVKWSVTPIAAALPHLAELLTPGLAATRQTRQDAVPLVASIAVWWTFEYLLHSARYQWNDLRGAAQDAVHPWAHTRRRLPLGGPPQQDAQRRRLSLAVLWLRILLAAATLTVLHRHWGPSARIADLALLVLVLGVLTLCYEAVRASTDWLPGQRTRARDVAVWGLVGLGYGVRAGTGFVLAGLRVGCVTMIVGGAYFTFLGVMFVLLTWALEAASCCWRSLDGRIRHRPALVHKSHVAALLPRTGIVLSPGPDPDQRDPDRDLDLAAVAVLDRPGGLLPPWTAALVVTAGLGGWTAGALLGREGTAEGPLVISMLGAALAWRHSRIVRHGRRRLHLALGCAGCAAVTALWWPTAGAGFVTALLWGATIAIFDAFRERTYADLQAIARRRRVR
jgi:hypothetical protein